MSGAFFKGPVKNVSQEQRQRHQCQSFPEALREAIENADIFEISKWLDSSRAEEAMGHGANWLDAEDSEGRTLVHYAASYGHPHVCLYFLHYDRKAEDLQSATPDRGRMNAKDHYDYTALDVAVKYERASVSTLLRQLGAKSNDIGLVSQFIDATVAGDTVQMKKLHKMVGDHLMDQQLDDSAKKYSLLNAPNAQGHSPLILASSMGNLKAVDWLCKHGASKTFTDNLSMTALDYAYRAEARVGHSDVTARLKQDEAVLKAQKVLNAAEEDSKEYATANKGKVKQGKVNPHDAPVNDAKQALATELARVKAEADEHPTDLLFFYIFVPVQLFIILMVSLFTEYDNSIKGNPTAVSNMGNPTAGGTQVYPSYTQFMDVHVMIFVGFGFLMTFLYKYSFSAVGFNFAVASLAIQWHVIVAGFWEHLAKEHMDETIKLTVNSFLLADFAAAAVLITFGALLGKVTPAQLLVIALFEVNFMVLNELITTQWLHISDMGGSMVVHVFGAYFGLAAAWVLKPKEENLRENRSSYRSDLFAMIGTLFLFIYWPSFTGGPAPAESQERAQVNTLLALCGSCLTGFCASAFLRQDAHSKSFKSCNKFDMVDIQNATLAGGVAIGTACDMDLHPAGAIVTGCCAGFLSVLGYTFIQQRLENAIGLYDTCGVNNLHGMPGILAAIVGVFATWFVDETTLPDCTIFRVWPGRYNDNCDVCTSGVMCPETRSAAKQAGFQMLYLVITLGVSIASGLATGFLVKLMPRQETDYDDDVSWEVPGYEHPFYFDRLSAKHTLVDGANTAAVESALFDPENMALDSKPKTTAAPAQRTARFQPGFIAEKIAWLLELAKRPRQPKAAAQVQLASKVEDPAPAEATDTTPLLLPGVPGVDSQM